MSETRRDFLIRIAKGSAYAAPFIRTLSAPERLSAQPAPSQKGTGGGTGGGMPTDATTQFRFGPSAPWSTDL